MQEFERIFKRGEFLIEKGRYLCELSKKQWVNGQLLQKEGEKLINESKRWKGVCKNVKIKIPRS